MKHFLSLLLLAAAWLPHASIAQQQHLVCNVNTGAYCSPESNPGNGDQGMPAWLAFGTSEINFDQLFTIFPSGALPSPNYGLQYNNGGALASLVPGSTGTWCLTWTSLAAAPELEPCGGGSGTVVSVGVTVPSWLTVSPATITTSGTFAISGVNQPNNYVLASAASGSQTVLAPRALVAADVPTLNQNTTGNAATATALGATPAQCASGDYAGGITANGTANCAQVTYAQLGGSVPTWNQNTTGNAATASSVPYSGLTGSAPTWNQSTTGNAATATALASSPAQCSAPNYSTGVTAAGVANCAQVAAGQLATGSLTNGIAATTQTTADNTTKVATDAFVVATAGAGNTTGTAAGLSGASVLPGGTTATTQSTSDTSADVATDAFVHNTLGTLGTFATQNYASPPAIGGVTPAAGAFSSLTDTAISGSTQCVQANSAGLLSGTGAACGASSGTITGVTAGTGLTGGGSSGTVTVALSTPVSAANGGTGLSGLGTGVATALGTAVGGAGAFVVNGGPLGTPSGGSGANLTGLPIGTGVAGLGTGIATALGVATGSTGAPALLGSAATFPTITDSGITGSTQCVQVNSSGQLAGTGAACGGSGSTPANPTGTVGLAAVNGTAATFLRSDGAPPLSQAIAPTWTGVHKFTNGTLSLLGSASGAMTLEAPSAAATYVITFPATTDTVGVLGTAQTYTAPKTFANTDLLLQGTSSGTTALASANAAVTNYTATVPANTGTFAETNLAQTFSALQTFGTDISIGGVTPTGATGTGNAVFSNNPVLVAPTLGAAAASSLTIAAPLGTAYGGTGAASLAAATIPVYTGTPTAGHCTQWLSSTVVEDSGAPCSAGFGNISDQTLLGNGSGGPALPTPLVLGAGLAATATTIGVMAPVNAQTGTTYAIAGGDAGKVVNRIVSSSCSDTLSAATASGFTPFFAFTYANSPTSTVACVLTPTTSTIGGLSSPLTVQPGQSCNITSDVSGNYTADSCSPLSPATSIVAEAVPASQLLVNVRLPPFNATGNGTTDDHNAVSLAVAYVNTLAAAGFYACVYLPDGTYYLNGAITQFAQTVPGCAMGDGNFHTFLDLGASFTGPVFSWSEAWLTVPLGTTYDYGGMLNGPIAKDFTITSNTSYTGQSGLVFYDRNDKAYISNVDVWYVNGPALSIGTTLNKTEAYMRESKIYNFAAWASGSSSVPAVSIGSTTTISGADATNELRVYGMDVFDPPGDGLVIDTDYTGAGAAKGTDDVMIFGLRAEKATSGNDLIRIGGPTVATGNITSTTGTFACTNNPCTPSGLNVGQQIRIEGTLSGSGSISGYTSGTAYKISATDNATFYTLQTLSGGTVTTTTGTTTGLTFPSHAGTVYNVYIAGLELLSIPASSWGVHVAASTNNVYGIAINDLRNVNATGGVGIQVDGGRQMDFTQVALQSSLTTQLVTAASPAVACCINVANIASNTWTTSIGTPNTVFTTGTYASNGYGVDLAGDLFDTAEVVGSPTGGNEGAGTVNVSGGFYVNGTQIGAALAGTSSSIGGGALSAGACNTTTVSVTGATNSMGVVVTPVTYPGDGAYWNGYVSASGVVTVRVCAAVALTPTASVYQVRVIQ